MLFLWTNTKHGKIWLDGDAFRQIITKKLPSGFYCQELSFVGEQNLLNVYVSIPEKDDQQLRLLLSDKFEDLFRPLGVAVRMHWTSHMPEHADGRAEIWKRPLFWAAVTGGVVGLGNLGIWGILWVAASAAAAFGISWLALTDSGKGAIRSLLSIFKKGE